MNQGKVLSIDLGSRNIHMIEGRYGKKGIEVEKIAEIQTPAGSFADGRIINQEALKDAIRSALLRNSIKTRNVILTIQSTAVITREFLLPVVKQDKFETMVKYEIERFLPIVASEYTVQYKLLNETVEDNVKKWWVQVAAIPKSIAEECYNLLKQIRLNPEVLDIHSNAVSKLFAMDQIINGRKYSLESTVAVIDFGYSQTGINIISKGKTEFCRTLMFGGKNIDTEISKCLQNSMEEAEKWKADNLTFGNVKSVPEDIRDSLNQTLDLWVGEIQKIILYFNNRSQNNKVETIYLCGGSSALAGLQEYIESHLGIHAEIITNLSCISVVNIDNSQVERRYINAIGGMIRC